MGIPIYHASAFTDRPFGGNPAAVCFPPEPVASDWMQAVATDMNLSETAYLEPRNGGFGLRWFTPAVEVALCGHATLASSHVLWETGRLPFDAEARFWTKSGELVCRRSADGLIRMDFPGDPPVEVDPPADLAAALGVEAVEISKGKFDYVVEVASAAEVRSAQPDFRALAKLPVRGVMVTARGDQRYDFISRFFGPGSGIDEDPVTGSAHCALACYWAPRLGKNAMRAFQASRRGGDVEVRVSGSRVELGGRAVITLRGELEA